MSGDGKRSDFETLRNLPVSELLTTVDEARQVARDTLPRPVRDTGGEETTIVNPQLAETPPTELVRRFRLSVVDGQNNGLVYDSQGDHCSIGMHALNHLVLEDPTVSRFHCDIRVDAEGATVMDLKSRNGTFVDGVRVKEAYLRGGSTLRLGRTSIRFDYGADKNALPLSASDRFGVLVGRSVPMRLVFATLERAAASDVTILLEGETGTGKGRAAESVHYASPRRDKPLLVIDCSAIPGNLLESELFGHEKGAFTGADARRIGAFEEASGGTIFLDEVGELPADLQPKLLRVLENREIRRIGSNRFQPVDVRVIAATNRDLREEVNAGRFRSDLYFRLAVVKVRMPSLRERPEDIPALVDEVLAGLSAPAAAKESLRSDAFVNELIRGAWPGNVRELRNHVERCLVLQDEAPLSSSPTPVPGPRPSAVATPRAYADARTRALAAFEKQYLADLLAHFDGKVAEAARCAGVDRVYLYRLMRKHGIKPQS